MNLTPDKRKSRRPLFLKGLRFSLFLFLGFVLLSILATGILYIYKNEIGEKILLSTNNTRQGKISFSDISFSLFVHFSSVSVHLHNVVYLENAAPDKPLTNDTIARLNSLYASINLLDIIKGDINVSRITLDGGEVRIVKYPDNSMNVLNAIQLKTQTDMNSMSDSSDADFISTIILKEISIKNLTISSLDFVGKDTTTIRVDKLTASFGYDQDTIQCAIKTTSNLISIPLSKKFQLTDKTLSLETSIFFDRSEQKLRIDPSHLVFENANFQFYGSINFSENGTVDIKIKGADEDMSLFNLLLTESGLKNLKSGKIYFDGSIEGSYKEEIPCFNFNFGFENLNLDIPDVNQSITNLNLEGLLNTGTQKDFSQARLQIKNFKGKLPDGYLNANLEVENFKFPRIDLLWDMKADITGFDEIFNIGGIENLSGRIEIYDEFTGSINIDSILIDEKKSNTTIIFDSISFNLPGIINVLNLDGQLHQNKDTTHFYELSLITDHSDLLINGRLHNLPDLLAGYQKEITADLTIKGDTFDLPQFLSFEPNIRKNFPYRIINMDLDVHAWSTTEKILHFNVNPEMDFEINHLDGTIENLFPPVSIKHGHILLKEKEQRIYMTFDNFDLLIANGQLYTDVEYFSPATDPDEVSVTLELLGLNPGKLLLYNLDSVSPLVNGNLSGKFNSDFKLGFDSLDFAMFDILAEKLVYTTQKDTIDVDELSINAKNIFIGSSDTHPLGNLYFDAEIKAAKLHTNYINAEDISYKIKTEKGVFTVTPENIQFMGKEGKGKGIFHLSPFAQKPTYEVNYTVRQFPMNNLLSTFMHDTLMAGNTDIDLNLTLEEIEGSDLLAGLNGYVHIYGKDLFMFGLNLDKVIKKFQKTQRFSLVDVGAVALAGPFGLALTKGSQYANLAINKSNDTTVVKQLISEWNIKNGKVMLDDVAFTTAENRVVGTGWINLATDSLKVIVAVVDINGCSILSQTIDGSLEEPKQSEMKLVGTVLAPITNLVGGALGKDCDKIYQGKLEHPLNKKKRKNE